MVKKGNKIRKDTVWGWLFVAPPLLGFCLFSLIPILVSIWLSFNELHSYKLENAAFVGLRNFQFVLTDSNFWLSVRQTFMYALSLPIAMGIALMLAMLLNKHVICKKGFRAVFFVPYVCSMVALTCTWKWMFDYNYGIVNGLLGKQINWLGDSTYFPIVMVLTGVWSSFGYYMLLYQAALTNINSAYLEAATLDGANEWHKFIHVVWPAITPITFYILITGLVGCLQDFARFQAITDEFCGPNQAGLTTVFYIYNKLKKDIYLYGPGIASAAAVLWTAVVAALMWLSFRLQKKWVSYDA